MLAYVLSEANGQRVQSGGNYHNSPPDIAVWILTGNGDPHPEYNTQPALTNARKLLANAAAYQNFISAGYINKAPTWGTDQAYYVNDNVIGPFTINNKVSQRFMVNWWWNRHLWRNSVINSDTAKWNNRNSYCM